MMVCGETDSEGTDSENDKWLKKIKEKKEEQKKAENKAEKKAEKKAKSTYTVTVQGSDAKELLQEFKKALPERSFNLEQEVLQNSFDVKA